jgi:hypothetical protein
MKSIKAREHHDQPVTEEVLSAALAQGRKRTTSSLCAEAVRYSDEFKAVIVRFADQTAVLLPVANYPELAALTAEQLNRIDLGFGGSAVCLESQDLHLPVAGLVSDSTSLMEMATSVIAARNGRRSSSAKASAARANGLKGGRPKKVVEAQ